ncbi:prenyltransferase [Corynebacterium senegalense]|uniref:prenyltransferase n=1 Tax=Corynebacterium senegalense TaxID=2080750 RepID=UPI000E1FEF65|nr:prenyltransferase [Corynebacterium senegalense]
MIRAILAASRPISWVNTAVPFALAYLLDTSRFDWLLLVGFVFFLIPYNIAMYGINDVFDYESDIRNPRKGGIEGAVLPKSLHCPLLIAAGVTTLPFALVLYAAGTWASALWLTLALFAVYAYSAPPFRFKETPVLDSVTSSAHFTVPALVGATIADPAVSRGFWLATAAFLLWGMASHALGAVQDVVADREGGLSSIATGLGARLTTRLACGGYAIAALLCFALPVPGWVVGVLGLGYAANALRFANVTDETSADVNRAWRVFLWLNFATGGVITIAVLFFLFPPSF